MLLQGIAWIDQSDFRIVHLRTDLLAPQPAIQVQKQTANIVFGPVNMAQHDSMLWLALAVNLEMESRGQVFHEQHRYSKYRLYQAKSRNHPIAPPLSSGISRVGRNYEMATECASDPGAGAMGKGSRTEMVAPVWFD
jgi:hypothetical protein